MLDTPEGPLRIDAGAVVLAAGVTPAIRTAAPPNIPRR
jgi:hypothetical protein